MRLLVALVFVLPSACADMEGWFVTEGPLFSWSKSELDLHAQLRIQDAPGRVGYGRVGAVSRSYAGSHLMVVAGYYFEDRRASDTPWLSNHRVFGGAEIPYRWGRWLAQGRAYLEQFIGEGDGTYKRGRERIQVGRATRLNPYASCEWVHDRWGLQFTRLRGGISFRAMPRATLDFSYSYDKRDARVGGSRQFILTTLEWERRP